MNRLFLMTLIFALFGIAPGLSAPVEQGEVTVGASGQPIPRFVSISAGRANLRSGPGEQYPILWVYERKLYPLQVIEEYEQWRKVRDIDGDEGWVHVVLLSGKRTGLVTGDQRVIYEEPDITSPPVARVEGGVIGEILECRLDWCRIDVGSKEGWIGTSGLWGIFFDEILD